MVAVVGEWYVNLI